MMIRKATAKDIDAVEKLYDAIHTAEENGKQTIGWIRGIYPVRKTAEMALARDDLFVLEDDGKICGTGILNKIQVDSYAEGHWEHEVPDEQVCVLHTLVIDPNSAGKGYGRAFIEYYETYAQENGCTDCALIRTPGMRWHVPCTKNTVIRKLELSRRCSIALRASS